MAITVPASATPEILDLSIAAANEISRLYFDDGSSVSIELYGGEQRPWAANPQRWTRPSRRWSAAIPVVHERWTKGAPSLAEIARWCGYAGLPSPISARTSVLPLRAGVPTFASHHLARKGARQHPYSYIEVEFADLISGPVAIGKLRHFGIGLFFPVNDRGRDKDD